MAKNNKYINGMRDAYRLSRQNFYNTELMASFALALKRCATMSDDDIYTVMCEVQQIWHEAIRDGFDVRVQCLKECNLDLIGDKG